jgi:hypothetical protein
LLAVFQTEGDEVDCLRGDLVVLRVLLWKDRTEGVQDQATVVDLPLGGALTEGLATIEQFKEDDTQRPHIDLTRNLWFLAFKNLRRKVPIGAHSLRGKLHPRFLTIDHDLTQSKVQNLHNSITEHDIAGLQIEVDHSLFELGEVGNC